MAYEHRDNSGTLFVNERKKTGKHPDYRGDGLINGTPVWISAWVKEGKRGDFLSLSFEPKQEQGHTTTAKPADPPPATARTLPKPQPAPEPRAELTPEAEAEDDNLPF